jgi:hypothetical protein
VLSQRMVVTVVSKDVLVDRMEESGITYVSTALLR